MWAKFKMWSKPKTQNSQENVLKIVGNKTNQHILKKVPRILLYHEKTEKTWTAISIAAAFHHRYPKRRIYVIVPASLRKNFVKEVYSYVYTYIAFESIMSYQEFTKRYKQGTINLHKSMVIVDEIQNVLRYKTGETYKTFLSAFHSNADFNAVLLTTRRIERAFIGDLLSTKKDPYRLPRTIRDFHKLMSENPKVVDTFFKNKISYYSRMVAKINPKMVAKINPKMAAKPKSRVKKTVSNFKPLGRLVKKTAIPIENFTETDCSQVITIPQTSGTCWFNALLMAILYSERSRRFFYNNLSCYGPTSVYKQNVINMFLNILARQYTKSEVQNVPTPERILHVLHQADPETFYIDPRAEEGYFGERYLTQLMKYFQLNKKVLYCIYPNPTKKNIIEGLYVHFDNIETKRSRYSHFNKVNENRGYGVIKGAYELEKYYGSKYIMDKLYGKNLSEKLSKTATDWAQKTKTNQKHCMNNALYEQDKPLCEVNGVMRLPATPDARALRYEPEKLDKALKQIATKATKNWANIDVIRVKIVENTGKDPVLDHLDFIRFTEGARVWNGQLKEEITVGGFIYKVDSMIISNVVARSSKDCGHEIAGVTCNGKRYLYSGLHRICPLMPFDWFSQNGDFCFNRYDCNFIIPMPNNRSAIKTVCFNMKHSERTYLYVKEQSLNVDRVCGKLKRNVLN